PERPADLRACGAHFGRLAAPRHFSGIDSRRNAKYRDGDSYEHRLRLARPDRRGDDRHQHRSWISYLQCEQLSPDRYDFRWNCHNRILGASHGRADPPTDRAMEGGALGFSLLEPMKGLAMSRLAFLKHRSVVFLLVVAVEWAGWQLFLAMTAPQRIDPAPPPAVPARAPVAVRGPLGSRPAALPSR